MDTRPTATFVETTHISSEAATASGVAWAAIIGGAFGAAGLVLILSPLGLALGYETSPWHYGAGRVFTIMSAIWLILVQWLSSGLGGYLTGRLRTKWIGAHTHEVFFRDTVHGFLSWALALVMGTILLVVLASTFGGNTQQNETHSETVNGLFRSATVPAGTNGIAVPVSISMQDRAESQRIIAMGVVNRQIPDNDRNYLVQLIVSRTGIPAIEAETRIDNAISEGRLMAGNDARASIYICLSLTIGAFIASVAGALGGIHRDVHYETGKLRL